MKIVFFADCDCNHGAKWIRLLASSHDVTLITHPSKNNFKLYVGEKNVKIHPVLPLFFPLRNVFRQKKCINSIRTIILKKSPDLVHSMYAIPYSFWPYLAKIPRHVITTRGSDILKQYLHQFNRPASFRERIIYYFLKKLTRRALQNAALITATSHQQADAIHKITGIPVKDIQVLRTGVQADRFLHLMNQASLSHQDEFVILSNRAMAPLYNIDIIIDSFVLFKKHNPAIASRLILLDYYTEENYRQRIIDQVKKSGLAHSIELVADQDEEGLARIYKRASLVVMVPSSDGTPVSAIEAMLARKPLIMGSIPYDSDLFNEQTIWKTDAVTPQALCSLYEVIYNEQEGMRSAKTEQAYHTARQLADTSVELHKLELLYQQLILH